MTMPLTEPTTMDPGVSYGDDELSIFYNIFDGLVVDTETGPRFADAPHVADIRAGAVTLSLTAAQAASLPEPSANPPALDSGDDLDSGLHHRLRRAWDLISGNY